MNNYIIQLFFLVVVLSKIIYLYMIVSYYLIIQQKEKQKLERDDQVGAKDLDKEEIERSYISLF